MLRSNPIIDRALDVFRLPKLYLSLSHWPECRRSGLGLAVDLLRWFFDYKTFPDNYGPCRLWEVNRSDWRFFYGSNYQAHQRAKLTREVQPKRYVILFHDKAICERLCQDPGIKMPRTYGTIRPRQEYREAIVSWLAQNPAGAVIIKPLLGAAGRDIVVARRQGAHVAIETRSGMIPLEQFELKEDALVQELVKQDARMAALSEKSLNTVRVVTMYTKDDQVIIVGASVRCGVGTSCVDNWSAGGLAVGVDVDGGVLRKYAYDKRGNQYLVHPTTQVSFEGFVIPEWHQILELATRTQRLFPCYRILGMDVGLAAGGQALLIEVNDSPDLLFQEQTSGPLLRREPVLKAFGEYDLLVNRHQWQLHQRMVGR